MDKDLLYRFFEGHASLEDMKVVKEWADASEENAGLLRRERKLFNAMILAGHSRRTDIQRMRNRRNYFIREFLKIASVIVITVSVTAVLFSIGKDNEDMYLAMQTITVPAGQRVNLDLPPVLQHHWKQQKSWLQMESKQRLSISIQSSLLMRI